MLAFVGAFTLADDARAADVNVRGSSEVSGYQDSVAVTVLTPTVAVVAEDPTAGYSVNGRYLVDIVTAASPDIVATASPRWNEVRNAGNLGFRYKPGTTGFAVNAAGSHTRDYLSLSGSATLLREVDEKSWSLALTYGFGHDIIGRTGTPNSVFSNTLDTHALTGSATRVLDSTSILTLTADVILERGDQSKPYRYIPIFSSDMVAKVPAGASPAEVAQYRIQARPLEQLPLARERYAVTARYAVRMAVGTLRLEERGYADTWALLASTTDARFYFDASERFILWPHLRAHLQSSVDFWQRAYTATSAGDLPALRTGDRELGALATLGGGGGVRWGIGPRGDQFRYAIQLTADAYYTKFFDALYVKYRVSALSALSMDVTF